MMLKIKGQLRKGAGVYIDKNSLILNRQNSELVTIGSMHVDTKMSFFSTDTSLIKIDSVGVNQFSVTAKDTGACYIKVVNMAGADSDSCLVTINPSQLPAPWQFENVADYIGSALYSNNIFTVDGSGSGDIEGQSDQFSFTNRDTGNNIYISARILSQTKTDGDAKAGLMFRETSNTDSKFVSLSATPSDGISFIWRDVAGSISSDVNVGTYSFPVYLKLVRNDSTFGAYKSTDGNSWTLLKTHKCSLGFNNIYKTGLFVDSRVQNVTGEAKFDKVNIGTAQDILSINSPGLNNIGIEVSPNPIEDKTLKIALNNFNNGNCNVEIVDITGRIIYNQTFKNPGNKLNINLKPINISKGVYMLVIKSGIFSGNVQFIVD